MPVSPQECPRSSRRCGWITTKDSLVAVAPVEKGKPVKTHVKAVKAAEGGKASADAQVEVEEVKLVDTQVKAVKAAESGKASADALVEEGKPVKKHVGAVKAAESGNASADALVEEGKLVKTHVKAGKATDSDDEVDEASKLRFFEGVFKLELRKLTAAGASALEISRSRELWFERLQRQWDCEVAERT